jgi:sugar lactone lactonase YvrE
LWLSTAPRPRLFANMTSDKDAGAPDSMKVDSKGNIWLLVWQEMAEARAGLVDF